MQHFPIFVAMAGRTVTLAGGGDVVLAKLRILMKSAASLHVFAADPCEELRDLHRAGKITLTERTLAPGDAAGSVLFYAATGDIMEDKRLGEIARADGVMSNLVDNLEDSEFITPAIVDRDPVTVAIGTEGAAPVLARAIKRDLEERLPTNLGTLARIGKTFRRAADRLPFGRKRRDFWSDYYFGKGPTALSEGGEDALRPALENLLEAHLAQAPRKGSVAFVGAGPGDPDLLTLKARKLLHEADVVVYDRLVTGPILDLARREAEMIDVGKEGFGTHTSQTEINALITGHALAGAQVVRLKSGDPSVYGRLDEEITTCEKAGVDWFVVPGITAASAAAASIGQPLTARGRNAGLRLLTGHDVNGFADQDWASLTAEGAVAVFYMSKRAARFLQGRLLMHGASPETPVSVVENASRPEERIIAATLGTLEPTLSRANLSGPAVLMYGLAPRGAAAALPDLQLEAL
ncbi:uroporphyrinogen-III C-methyltransferase [Alphaproteobacteria bacterium KMM 3653]|uniref:Uroporphyrinogen-III C-methyltransferase n=1 Tax=Harenicola maris TaxID=2841044 RepID=A0AAP2G6M0_9RHOB|nr:uroporphyrinogen-III C-methyltransferase [Harenicola maris]